MPTHGQALDLEIGPDNHDVFPRPVAGPLARLGWAIMKQLRLAAWGLLDLHTEFEPLD